ncbi:cytochrome P450 [Amylostereum chailletii]|nr:cytochrome P450 [Amylostereum chailletii]
MALLELLGDVSSIVHNSPYSSLLALVLVSLVVVHVVPWFRDALNLRVYPGPWMAQFSDMWLTRIAFGGHRSEVVESLHDLYGPFVRIAPNHVSISAPEALEMVYGHGAGAPKTDFYEYYVAASTSIVSARSRVVHARKRKIVSHVFSPRTISEFEPLISSHVAELLTQLDSICEKGRHGFEGDESTGWVSSDGRVWLDIVPWLAYVVFDIIGDLAFGSPFGMVKAGKDVVAVAASNEKTMGSYGKDAAPTATVDLPAIRLLRGRSDFNTVIGVIPIHWRPFIVRFVPWFSRGHKCVASLAGIAAISVSKRLADPESRPDFLTRLLQGKDDEGNPLCAEELTAESMTLLTGGSDTIFNTLASIVHHIAANPRCQDTLRKELTGAIGADGDAVCSFADVKNLSYLEACVNEAMRLHSTFGIGLPREVPEGGLTIRGHTLLPGTVVSVPTYTVHRDVNVWGLDAHEFRPEHWLEEGASTRAKYFAPFSIGPRACVARNLAIMEVLIIIGSLVRRYDFVLEDPKAPIERHEGVVTAVWQCKVGVKRRL